MRNRHNDRKLVFGRSRKGSINTPTIFEEVKTVSSMADAAYKQGRDAMRKGISQLENPYPHFDLSEANTLWTARDCWQMGWEDAYSQHMEDIQ